MGAAQVPVQSVLPGREVGGGGGGGQVLIGRQQVHGCGGVMVAGGGRVEA